MPPPGLSRPSPRLRIRTDLPAPLVLLQILDSGSRTRPQAHSQAARPPLSTASSGMSRTRASCSSPPPPSRAPWANPAPVRRPALPSTPSPSGSSTRSTPTRGSAAGPPALHGKTPCCRSSSASADRSGRSGRPRRRNSPRRRRCCTTSSARAPRTRRTPGHPPALTAASHDGHAKIRITDHGPAQAKGTEPDTLGFRLARDVTEAMGDTLRCEQGADYGRTVVITLPAATNVKPQRPASAARPWPSVESRRLRRPRQWHLYSGWTLHA